MTDLSPHSPEPAEPHPRRYRWLLRLAAGYVLIAAAVAGLRWWWGDLAERRFAATVAAAHARGQKIVVADFVDGDAPLPDEQNSAFYLGRAETGIRLSTTEDWAMDNSFDLPLRDDVAAIVGRVLEERPAVLADIRTARNLNRADWGVTVVSPMWAILLPHLNRSRVVCNFSRSAAMHAAHRGDHAAAIEHVRDILGVSRSLDDDMTFLVTHLVRVGIDGVAADAAGKIARELQIAGAPRGAKTAPAAATPVVTTPATAPPTPSPATTAPAAVPASRDQVRALIAMLLDDGPRRASQQNALEGERAMQIDVGVQVGKRIHIVRPAVLLDVIGLAKEGDQLMAAGAAPDWPTALPLVPKPPAFTGPRATAHLVSQSVRPALGRALSTSIRATANARLAALALAIRLYQLDHADQRPPTLGALVPAYLSAVPLDPYSAGGQPMRYVSDPVAPYLYSVGENGKNDSAASTTTAPWRPDAKTLDPATAPDLFLRLTTGNAPPPQVTDPPVETPAPTTMASPL